MQDKTKELQWMPTITYSASSGDGTICSDGMTHDQAFRRAQEIADQTGDIAVVANSYGDEWEVEPSEDSEARQ